jgi:hypothetical protein
VRGIKQGLLSTDQDEHAGGDREDRHDGADSRKLRLTSGNSPLNISQTPNKSMPRFLVSVVAILGSSS